MKAIKITYYVATVLLSLQVLMSASMYFFKNVDIRAAFSSLGYPEYLIYPLAIAKLLGVTAIWVNKYKTLKDFAYAGFLFNFLLAAGAHIAVGDGNAPGAIVALVLWVISFWTYKKLK